MSELLFWLMVAALILIVLYGLWHEAVLPHRLGRSGQRYRIEDLPPLENSRRPK